MFAFALWDARRRRLLLARDRVGKKPLFYHDGPRVFAFASEIKALLAHPEVPHERDPDALPLFLTYGYVPTPARSIAGSGSCRRGTSWSVTEAGAEVPTALLAPQFRSDGPGREARDRCSPTPRPRSASGRCSRQAVERRLITDVPLGAFLSGGIDSSTVVALMAEAAGGRVKTFSIGFDGHPDYDERAHARVVARALRHRPHRVRGRADRARPRGPARVAPRRAVRRRVGGPDVHRSRS